MEKEKYGGGEVRSGTTKSNKTQRSPEGIGKAEKGNGGDDEKMKGENEENDEKFKGHEKLEEGVEADKEGD